MSEDLRKETEGESEEEHTCTQTFILSSFFLALSLSLSLSLSSFSLPIYQVILLFLFVSSSSSTELMRKNAVSFPEPKENKLRLSRHDHSFLCFSIRFLKTSLCRVSFADRRPCATQTNRSISTHCGNVMRNFFNPMSHPRWTPYPFAQIRVNSLSLLLDKCSIRMVIHHWNKMTVTNELNSTRRWKFHRSEPRRRISIWQKQLLSIFSVRPLVCQWCVKWSFISKVPLTNVNHRS